MSKNAVKIVVAVVLLLVIAMNIVVPPLVIAISGSEKFMINEKTDDNEENGEVDDIEEEHELRVYFSTEGGLEIESDDNEIEFEDTPKLRFEYWGNNSEIYFYACIIEISEFVDSNGNNVMDEDDEEILDVLYLDGIEWDLKPMEGFDPLTNNTWYGLTYSYDDGEYNVTIIMQVFQKSTDFIDGGADEVKIDIRIYKWPWQDDNSILAVTSVVELYAEAEGSVQTIDLPEVDGTGIFLEMSTGVFVKYVWTSNITVDGNSDNIINSYYREYEMEYEESTEGNYTEKEVGLEVEVITVYPRFTSSLIHDPSVGVEDDSKDLQTLEEIIQPSTSEPTQPTEPTQPQPEPWYRQRIIVLALGFLSTLLVVAAAIIKKNKSKV